MQKDRKLHMTKLEIKYFNEIELQFCVSVFKINSEQLSYNQMRLEMICTFLQFSYRPDSSVSNKGQYLSKTYLEMHDPNCTDLSR